MPGGGPAQFDQRHARFGNDDGTADPATWVDVEDANISAALDTNIRLRLVISDTAAGGITPAPGILQLQYSKNGGAYSNVTGSSSNVRSHTTTHFADADAVTRKLTQYGSNTFSSAGAWESSGATSGFVALGGSSDTEIEFCFQLRSADVSNGDTFDFKLTWGGLALNAYTKIPRVTATTGTPPETPTGKNAHKATVDDVFTAGPPYIEIVTGINAHFGSVEPLSPPGHYVDTVTGYNAHSGSLTAILAAVESVGGRNAQRGSASDVYSPPGNASYEFVTGRNAHRATVVSTLTAIESVGGGNAQKGSIVAPMSGIETVTGRNAHRGTVAEAISWIATATGKNAHSGSTTSFIKVVEAPAAKNAQKATIVGPATIVEVVTAKNAHRGTLVEALVVVETPIGKNAQKAASMTFIVAATTAVGKIGQRGGSIDLAKIVDAPAGKNAHRASSSSTRLIVETVTGFHAHRASVADVVALVATATGRNAHKGATIVQTNIRNLIPAIRFNIAAAIDGLTAIPEAGTDATIGQDLHLDYAVIVAGEPSQSDYAVNDVGQVVPVDIVLVRATLSGIDNAQRQRQELFVLQHQILSDYQMFGGTQMPSANNTRIVGTPYDRQNAYQTRFSALHQNREITISVLSIECDVIDAIAP